MKTVIGISGVKRSGKNTVGMMIREFVEAEEKALADKIKETCSKVFDVDIYMFTKEVLKETPFKSEQILTEDRALAILKSYKQYPACINLKPIKKLIGTKFKTPRQMLQIIGTEFLRSLGNPDIHCENVQLSENNITVITDIRFPNEYEYFSNLENTKFVPIYVQRDDAEANLDDHSSEKLVLTFSDKCIKIDNNKGFGNTELQVQKIIEAEIFGNK